MKLSVIIPVYNAESYIEATIKSILKQVCQDVEVILVDDGSKDGSGRVCDEYAGRYPQYIRVFHTCNHGVSAARNYGLQKATGEYVFFLDADDVVMEGFCAYVFKIMEQQPDVIVFGYKRVYIEEVREVREPAPQEVALHTAQDIGAYLNGLSLQRKQWLLDYVWNKCYKRKEIEKNKLQFNTQLSVGEDVHFNCQFFSVISSAYISKEIFYVYNMHGNGLVNAFQPRPWIDRQRVIDAYVALFQTHGILEKNISGIYYAEGINAFAAFRSINSPRCRLTKGEKKVFIQNMASSKQKDLALYYLSHSGKKNHRIWHFFLEKWGMFGISVILLADKANRHMKRLGKRLRA